VRRRPRAGRTPATHTEARATHRRGGFTVTPFPPPQVGHGPSMALVLRHLSDRYGKPVEVLGTRGAAARNTLQRELEEVGG
jgi:hypothetical protein